MHSISYLSENQIAFVQKSIESLYNIQDRDSLIKAIVTEASYLIGEEKVYLLVYDRIAKDFIPYGNVSKDGFKAKELVKVAKDYELHKVKNKEIFVHHNFWFFPYQANNKLSGFLALSPSLDALSEEKVKLLQIFMQSVPILLENSRLYLLMTRKTKSLTFMSQLHELIGQYSFQEALAEVVEKVGALLNTDMAGIMLYDPNKNELQLQKPAFGIWKDSMIEQYKVSINDTGNAKSVFMTGVPSITNDAFQNPNYNQRIAKLFNAKSIVTVPLTVEGKRIGVLHAINNKEEKYFTQVDVQSLMEISEQLGTLIQGALQLSRQQPAQQNRREIERYLSEQLIDLLLYDTERAEEIEKISDTLGFELAGKKSVIMIKFKDEYTEKLKQYDYEVRRAITKIIPTSLIKYKQKIYTLIVAHHQNEEMELYGQRLSTALHAFASEKFGQDDSSAVYIGIGDAVSSLQDVCKSHQQAKQILNIMPKLQLDENNGYYPQLGSWTLLTYVAGNNEIALPFVQYHLNTINQMKDASVMKETLEAFLKHNGQFNKAAEELFIHPNTLKYRMAKLEDVTNYNFHDSETRFNLHLALRLEKMLDP